jgi:hypothetical protein
MSVSVDWGVTVLFSKVNRTLTSEARSLGFGVRMFLTGFVVAELLS